MSTENPERPEGEADEVINLNSEELEVQELDEKALENVAGGEGEEALASTCGNFIC